MPLGLVQIRPREQVLVDANRSLDFAPPPEQVAERKMGLERLVVDFGHLHEQLERFVRLAAQHEIQSAEIVGTDPRRQVPVAVAVDLERETARRRDDEQCGEQERGFSGHLAAASAQRAAARPRRSEGLAQPPFLARVAPERKARREQAEQPAADEDDRECERHRNLLDAESPMSTSIGCGLL